MAYEIVRTKSIKATGSLATSQFCFVKLDTNGGLVLPSAGGNAIGVLQDKPGAGDPGAVCFPGDITKVKAGGTVTAGNPVMTDASGQAVNATSGSVILGEAITGTTTSGQVVDIIYQPRGAKL